MSSQKIISAALLAFFLCGCGEMKPFVDRIRNPGQSGGSLYRGPSTPEAPVICYNPLLTNDAELQSVADAECKAQKTGDSAEFVKKGYFEGRLLLPAHAYYKCVKK